MSVCGEARESFPKAIRHPIFDCPRSEHWMSGLQVLIYRLILHFSNTCKLPNTLIHRDISSLTHYLLRIIQAPNTDRMVSGSG